MAMRQADMPKLDRPLRVTCDELKNSAEDD